MEKRNSGRAWHGRSYDLGRMTLSELWRAYARYPAIRIYVALAVVAAGAAVAGATHWGTIVPPVLAVLIAYPVAWYFIHRFILHGRWLYKMKWSAALWKRIHFDHHQDPHKLEVLFGAPGNTIPTMPSSRRPGLRLGGLAWCGDLFRRTGSSRRASTSSSIASSISTISRKAAGSEAQARSSRASFPQRERQLRYR